MLGRGEDRSARDGPRLWPVGLFAEPADAALPGRRGRSAGEGLAVHAGRISVPRFAQRLIMLLDMDAFFASAEQVARPELKGKPVIVGGEVHDRSVVASASYEARARGVRTAMPIAQAYRLCPEGVFLRGNFSLYKAFSQQVLEICKSFTPVVRQASIDEAYLDLTGTERLYLPGAAREVGSRNWPVDLAQRLLRTIKQRTGLGASIGIGSNPLIARIATARAKPGGICFVWPGYEASFLAPQPLRDIPGIGRRTAEMLEDYNLRTAGDVQAVDPDLLIASFGDRLGRMLHEWAWGRAEAELPPEDSPKSVGRQTSFEQDTTDIHFIRAMLYYLTERACRQLRRIHMAASVVAVRLRYSDFQTFVKSRTLAEPSNHEDVCYALAADLLERLYTRRMAVRLVGVHLSGLVDAGQVQLQIWDQQRYARRCRLYEAADRIRDKFGFSALTKGLSIELLNRLQRDENGFKLRTSCLTR